MTPGGTVGARTRASGRPPGRARAVLALACAAQLMVVLDVSVINVALPSLHSALGFSDAGLAWVSNAYLLAFGGCLLLGGRLADAYGHRRVFLAGLVLFTAAGLLGGAATGPGMLVAARAGQGLGAAVLAPVTLTLVTTTFPEGPHRTRALASWTVVSVAGGAVGNLVGGVLTQSLSWRWTLLINVPVGALTLLAAVRTLPGDPAVRREGNRIDVPGAVLASAGLAALLYGITGIQENGFAAVTTLGALVGGVLTLAVFVWVEARCAPAPLLPPGLFRLRTVAAGNTVMLLAGACFQAPMWYFLTFFMQRELHYTPLRTGLGFLPHTLITIMVGWRLTPLLMRHVPARTLIVLGTTLAAVGFVWQSRQTAESGYLLGILAPAVVFTVGGGLFNTPLTTTVTSGVAVADAGAASGLMNTTKQIGGALGLAALVGAAMRPRGEVDYGIAFLASAGVLLLAALVALALPAHKDATACR